jgi:hypothetical protein
LNNLLILFLPYSGISRFSTIEAFFAKDTNDTYENGYGSVY